MFPVSKLIRLRTNPKLQDDIERNLKLRDGASRILAVAANTIQRLDAAKTIIVSNSRLVVSMQQLQREKADEANAASATVSHGHQGLSSPVMPSKHFCTGKATLCLSGIRIPLLWKDTSLTPNASSALNRLLDPSYRWASGASSSHFSTFGRQQRPISAVLSVAAVGALAGGETSGEVCSAFCIVRVGDQIRETRLLCEVYPGSADLEFDDVLTFGDVQPNFECGIEIYGCQSSNGQGTNSFLRRKSQIDCTSAANRNSVFLGTLTPEYAKVGTEYLGERVSAHPLELLSSHGSSLHLSPSSSNFPFSNASALHTSEDVLPLFGPICFSLTALPDSVQRPVLSGLLWIRSSLKSNRESTEEPISEVRLRGSSSKVVKKPLKKWDIQLKVDPVIPSF
ncbi:unnamed protein product [Hydatigera taeniaeformis]|uniref:Anillin domain-containing protein n=1 Tax=Hydatigena taeniaeformis TaxID=6205 RepID=A0A0R3X9A4_HYDTA|nr:unnamed protein product [Hydatigera taeniaeformis]